MGAEVKRIWKIMGYDGSTEIFSEEVSGALTDGEIGRILQRLVARHLTEREVVAASLRKNMAGYARPALMELDRTVDRMIGGHHDVRACRRRSSSSKESRVLAKLIRPNLAPVPCRLDEVRGQPCGQERGNAVVIDLLRTV
jgi:hypothetical protein